MMLALLFALIAGPHVERLMAGDHHIAVYAPADYDAKKTYDVIFFFDGDFYIDDLGALPLLPHSTIAVTIDNSQDRLGDLANHATFAELMAKQVVPAVRARWNVSRDPAHVTVAGYSAGGLAAAYVAFRHPELFGNVLSQSGAFWRGNEGASQPGEWLTEQFRKSPRLPLRFYMEVGGEESHPSVNGIAILDANRHLHDVLRAKGYTVQYKEIPGAHHEPGHWKAALPDAIAYLFR